MPDHTIAARSPQLQLFTGFPYLVTRVVPALYHIIVLPDDDLATLVDIAHQQARANVLPTCLVRAADRALYIWADGQTVDGDPPRASVIVTGRLHPCRAFPETTSLVGRRAALEQFIERAKPKGLMFGDLTKGGRAATPEETVSLAGVQPGGAPTGLARCGGCGEWRGRCLDPSPDFAGQVMDVHCRCDNDNRCAACGGLLHARKLNANEYNEADGQLWLTPGFSGLSHVCGDRVTGGPEAPSRRQGAEREQPVEHETAGPRPGAPVHLELDESAAGDLVYGELGGNLVFLERQRAETLAAIKRALWSSSTWGEVRDRIPAEAYEELLEISGATELPDFEGFYAEARLSRPRLTQAAARVEYLALSLDARPPEPGDPFEAGEIGAICEDGWPGWPAQEMLEWVPESIRELYGTGSCSMVSGDCLLFQAADETAIVAAFVALGYTCVRDDALVERATGG